MTHIPQPPDIRYIIDEYVTIVFKHLSPDVHNTSPEELKKCAYGIIPSTDGVHPHRDHTLAAGVIYCALIVCDSRVSRVELVLASGYSPRLIYVSPRTIGKAASYVRAANNLDINW